MSELRKLSKEFVVGQNLKAQELNDIVNAINNAIAYINNNESQWLENETGEQGLETITKIRIGQNGEVLSPNDNGIIQIPKYTENADQNVQADWNQTNSSKSDYIKNKPTIPSPQIQSNWTQTDNTKADYIKNKPIIPSGVEPATSNPLMDGTAAVGTSIKFAREDHRHPSDTSKQDVLISGQNISTINGRSLLEGEDIIIQEGGRQEQSDWNQTVTTEPSYIKNKPNLSNKIDKSITEVDESSITNVNSYIVQECAKASASNNYHHIIKINRSANEYFFINIYELVSGSDYKEYKICGYITANGTTLGLSTSLSVSYYKEYAIKITNNSINACIQLIYNYSFDNSTSNLNIS